MSLFVHTGVLTCWNEGTTNFSAAPNLHMEDLSFSFACSKDSGITGKCTRCLLMLSVTEFLLRKFLPIKMFPLVGKTTKVSSNFFLR